MVNVNIENKCYIIIVIPVPISYFNNKSVYQNPEFYSRGPVNELNKH